MGALQGIGGVVEIVGSGVGEWFSGGVATPLMVPLFLNGVDNTQAGFRQLWTGETTETLLHQGTRATAKALGASNKNAERIANIVDISTILLGNVNALSKAKTLFTKSSNFVKLTSRSVIAADKTLKNVKGIYIHIFKNGKVYVGKSKDLSTRPWTSLQELLNINKKGTAVKTGSEYLETQLIKLSDTKGFKNIEELEAYYIKKFGGVMSQKGSKTLNIKNVNPK